MPQARREQAGLQAGREVSGDGPGTLEGGMGGAQSRQGGQVARPWASCQHAQDTEPTGPVSGSGARRPVPAAVSTGKPSRIQYSMPPIISLTR
jgi:hypothetical protein